MSFRTFIAIIAGLLVGLWIADLDQIFPFLRHRSILTHGLVLVGVAYALLRNTPSAWARPSIAALALGMAVHLSFDLFPRAWYGFALITIPFVGTTGSTFSTLWLALNVLGCICVALWLLRDRTEAVVAFGGMALGFCLAASRPGTALPALLTLLTAAILAAFLPNPLVRGQTLLRQVFSRPPSA